MTCPATNRCEDFPCCGHANEGGALDPMFYYCENCGISHQGDCPDDVISEDDDDYDEAFESSI